MATLLLGIMMAIGATSPGLLVETEGLASIEQVIVVDTRGDADFSSGHIPGAAHLDVDTLSETREGVVGLLKPRDELLIDLAAAGLVPSKTLVVYSGMKEVSDLKRATRLFWALEYAGFPDVRLLDGGLSKWKTEGRAVEEGPTRVKAIPVDALKGMKAAEELRASREDITRTHAAQKGIIVDLRGKKYFTGASKKDYVERSGHITGATNRPAPTLVDGPHFTFGTSDFVRELLITDNNNVDVPVLTYCNSGRDATVGYVAYRLAGFKKVSVYDGSMAEWGNNAACPMSTGPEKEK